VTKFYVDIHNERQSLTDINDARVAAGQPLKSPPDVAVRLPPQHPSGLPSTEVSKWYGHLIAIAHCRRF
jgi:hypothetical protein